MAITFLEPGGSATGSLGLYSSSFAADSGSVAVDASVVHGTNPYSLKLDWTGSFSQANLARTGTIAYVAGGRISMWVRVTGAATRDTGFLLTIWDGSFNVGWRLKIKSTGKLSLAGETNSDDQDANTTFPTSTWFRVCVAWEWTSRYVNTAKLYQDGVLVATLTNVSWDPFYSTGPGGQVLLGNIAFNTNSIPGGPLTVWVSDLYVDNTTGLADVGDVWVTAKRPATDNTSQFDTAIGASPSAGSRYTNVNERPTSDTNGWKQTAASQVSENYTLEAQGAGDVAISGTLLGHMGWIRWKVDANSGTPALWLNGATTNLTNRTSAGVDFLCATSASYPSDAAGIGLRSSSSTPAYLYECGVCVAWIPSSGGRPQRHWVTSGGRGNFSRAVNLSGGGCRIF